MRTIFKFILASLPRPMLINLSILAKPLLIVFLKGKNYEDPIDGKRFRRFLPYGYVVQRDNVLSPSTLSLERHRLLWLYLKNETDFFTKPKKLLHFAPEQAFYKRFKKIKHFEYTTTDINSPIAKVKADICNLPFKNNSFDTILCNHVLEHILDDIKAMQELFRVMKPGGMGVFQVPQDIKRDITFEDHTIKDTKEREKLFGQYDHVRVYGMDYFKKLEDCGFTVKAVNYTSLLSSKEIDKYRLTKGEIIPVVYKP